VAKSNWWAWSGGFFGALYIAVSIVLLPRLGAAFFIALLIAGQMIASIAFDHFGLLGLAPHPLDASRIFGALLLVRGVGPHPVLKERVRLGPHLHEGNRGAL
jgi:transporter family-2 protein